MFRTLTCVVGVLILLSLSLPASAKPTYGPTCINCHAKVTGKLSLLGNTSTLNLGTKRLDGQRPGALKLYTVSRGKTLPISIRVSSASSKFDVDVYFASVKGLKNSRNNKLKFTTDAAWFSQGNPVYYLLSRSAISYSKAKTYVYNLKVSSTTPLDVYEVYVNLGGKGGGLWGQQERIYVQVVP
jgi:hypothetical protein